MEDFLSTTLIDDTFDLPNIVIRPDHRPSNFSDIAYDIYTGDIVMGYNGTSYIFIDELTDDQRNLLTHRHKEYIKKGRPIG